MTDLGVRTLFHTLVVMGASLAGCGGKVGSEPTSSSSGGTESGGGAVGGTSLGGAAGIGGGHAGMNGAGTGGAGPISAADCEAPSQWKCNNYELAQGCRCDASAPRGAEDCETPFDFTCDRTRQVIGTEYGVGCRCDSDALVPTDCEHTEQFSCRNYQPYFEQCVCNSQGPLSQADCTSCSSFSCWNIEPRYGCTCQACIR